MAFGNKAKDKRSILVYEYGCRALDSVGGEHHLVEVCRRRNVLWNEFVSSERAYRAVCDPIIAAGVIGKERLNEIRGEKKRLREEIKARRKRVRSGKADVSDLVEEIARLDEEAQKVRESLVFRLSDEQQKALDEADAARRRLIRAAVRRASAGGLWWQNADDEVKEYDNARKRAMKDRRGDGSRAQLNWHQFDGSGKASVRLRARGGSGPWGMPVENVFRPNNVFWIEPVSPEAWYSPSRKTRRAAANTVAHFRVGSLPDGQSAWVTLPIVMHRPLPDDAEIREAAIIRERVGAGFRHKLTITVGLPLRQPREKIAGPAVGVDVGYRRVRVGPDTQGEVWLGRTRYAEGQCPEAEGLRVAFWHGEDGRYGQLVLPDAPGKPGFDLVAGFSRCDDLRSLRDEKFNHAKADLAAWLRTRSEIPAGLRVETHGLEHWRSHDRLADLARRWSASRFPGDETIFAVLRNWVEREEHLYAWEANLRDKLLGGRREVYRMFAAWLAREYDAVFLEHFDLRGVARKPKPEEDTQGAQPQDRNRTIAALSSLRGAIVQACHREGRVVKKVEAAYSTLECHVCGNKHAFDAAAQIMHRCPTCGTVWDQDHNAARVLLARGLTPDSP